MNRIMTSLLLLLISVVCGPIPVAVQAQEASTLSQRIQTLKDKNSVATAKKRPSQRNPTYDSMLKSVALIETVTDDEVTYGTGWVIDRKQRLLVTNHHVIEWKLDCNVYFPEFANGKLKTDPETSITEDRSYFGRVIDSDSTLDLALIQLDELPKNIVALELADESASPGETIHSIAGSTVGSQSLWIYSTGHVRQIVEGMLANGHETLLLESDMATNQGNSGGPVCNDDGKVVAVVEGHRTDARLVSIYVDLQTLVEYMSAALRCVAPQSVDDLQFAADRHYEDDRPSVAAKLITKMLRKQPNSAEWYSFRGWCYYSLDDGASAKADFEQALQNDATYSEAHQGLARLASDEGEYDAAIKHLTDAIRNEREVWYFVDRGEAYRLNGDYKKAVSDLETALQMDDENSDAIRQLGMTRIDLEEYKAGVALLDKIINEFDEDPDTLVYGSIGMHMLEEYEAAFNLCTLALNVDPTNAAAYFRKGITLAAMKRREDAATALRKAYELAPNNSEFVYYHGLALATNGELQKGIDLVKRACDMAPTNQEYQTALKALKKDATGKSVPAKTTMDERYIGQWNADIQDSGDRIKMQLTLRGNGTYEMKMHVAESSGQTSDFTDVGQYEISNNQLVYRPNGEAESRFYQIKWQGPHLGMYMEPLNGWALLSRSP